MPTIGVDVILMKGSYCLLGQCTVWTDYGEISINSAQNKDVVSGVANGAPCENGMYKGEALHYIVDSNGKFYHGFTEEKNEVTNCA